MNLKSEKEEVDFKKEREFGGTEAPPKTTRDKVEAWLKAMPKELILSSGVELRKITTTEQSVDERTPFIVDNGYEITMNFKTATWEEDLK